MLFNCIVDKLMIIIYIENDNYMQVKIIIYKYNILINM